MVTWMPLSAPATEWALAVYQVISNPERYSVSTKVREQLSMSPPAAICYSFMISSRLTKRLWNIP